MGVGVLTQTIIQCHSNLISTATMNISDIISKVLVFFLSFSVIVVYFIVGLTEKQLMLAGENFVLQPPPIRH